MKFEHRIEKHKHLICKFSGSAIWRKYNALKDLRAAYFKMNIAFKNADYTATHDHYAELEYKYLAMGLLYDRTMRTINGW